MANAVPLQPGATLGLLGGGQLGRMFTLAAVRMGYRVHVFAPEADPPAAHVAQGHTRAPYEDTAALKGFAATVDAVTLEFENIPASALDILTARVPVRPGPRVLHTTQHRLREKQFLAGLGIPVVPFHPVGDAADLRDGVSRLGLPAVLKTAGFGYDGKGQQRLDSPDRVAEVSATLQPDHADYVLERFIAFEREVSLVACRSVRGEIVCYPLVENRHERHILDVTRYPANISPAVQRSAEAMAREIMEALDVVGVLCVEFFLLADQTLLVNELAPRPHNSGHWTIEACRTSQFEQQVRALCGLPPGDPTPLVPAAVMVNLLGDGWDIRPPDWAGLAREFPDVKLHLYGKAEPRAGRKMGHLTLTAGPEDAGSQNASPEALTRRVLAARQCLLGAPPAFGPGNPPENQGEPSDMASPPRVRS